MPAETTQAIRMLPPTWCPACHVEQGKSVALVSAPASGGDIAFRCPSCAARYVLHKAN